MKNFEWTTISIMDLTNKELVLIKRAEITERETGVELFFFEEEWDRITRSLDITEDDGNIHFTMGRIRACFWMGQELTKTQFNKIAKEVLKGMWTTFTEFKKQNKHI